MRGIYLLSLMFVASGALAAPPPPALSSASHSAPANVPDNAMRLSQLANPAEHILEIGLKAFEAGMSAELKNNPEDAAFFAANPGLLGEITKVGRLIVRRHFLAAIPGQQRRYAQFYAAKFSPEEIDQLISFYSSPTGAKVVRAMFAGVDLKKLSEGVSPEGKPMVTASQILESKRSSMSGLLDEFDADDWKSLFTFMSEPVHAKLLKVVPEFNQLVADMANEPTPELDAELEKAVQKTTAAYFVRRGAKPKT